MRSYDKTIKVGDVIQPKKGMIVDFTKQKVKRIINSSDGDVVFDVGKNILVEAWKVKKCRKRN